MAGECGLDPTHLPPPGALVTTISPWSGRKNDSGGDGLRGRVLCMFFGSKMLKRSNYINISDLTCSGLSTVFKTNIYIYVYVCMYVM
jgi:hypothetical protein